MHERRARPDGEPREEESEVREHPLQRTPRLTLHKLCKGRIQSQLCGPEHRQDVVILGVVEHARGERGRACTARQKRVGARKSSREEKGRGDVERDEHIIERDERAKEKRALAKCCGISLGHADMLKPLLAHAASEADREEREEGRCRGERELREKARFLFDRV